MTGECHGKRFVLAFYRFRQYAFRLCQPIRHRGFLCGDARDLFLHGAIQHAGLVHHHAIDAISDITFQRSDTLSLAFLRGSQSGKLAEHHAGEWIRRRAAQYQHQGNQQRRQKNGQRQNRIGW